ncbi:MAG: NAD(P)/FAD-dependent oxidoreductase [Bacteroidota bacterium]
MNCAEQRPGQKIVILEKGRKVLAKVKISGGGRCNVTHACFTPRDLIAFYPRGSKALLGPFHRFCTSDTVAWFEERGVETKIEQDGRMFPITDDSQTIINCLWRGVRKHQIEVLTNHRVAIIRPVADHWEVQLSDDRIWCAPKVLCATGSSPAFWKILQTLGHRIVPPVPSLFTFNIDDERLRDLPGLSVPHAKVKIIGSKLQSEGPLLITHWGLSGPAVLKLSAWGARQLHERAYDFRILVNWLGEQSAEEVMDQLMAIRQSIPKKQILTKAPFELPSRLWKQLVLATGLPGERRWAELGNKALKKMAHQLTAAEFAVKGKSTFKEEFVTAGGIDLKEVNFKTFESKLFKGLHFAGEVLDIDAVTGGFNFQAAWTGAWIAAQAMAES